MVRWLNKKIVTRRSKAPKLVQVFGRPWKSILQWGARPRAPGLGFFKMAAAGIIRNHHFHHNSETKGPKEVEPVSIPTISGSSYVLVLVLWSAMLYLAIFENGYRRHYKKKITFFAITLKLKDLDSCNQCHYPLFQGQAICWNVFYGDWCHIWPYSKMDTGCIYKKTL